MRKVELMMKEADRTRTACRLVTTEETEGLDLQCAAMLLPLLMPLLLLPLLCTAQRPHLQDNGTAAELAEKLAARAGLVSWGQVGLLSGVFSMAYLPPGHRRRPGLDELRRLHGRLGRAEFQRLKGRAEASLARHRRWPGFSQEILRSRRPRSLLDTCNDPFAVFQWHLRARTPSEFDVNVTGVWQEGNLGEGVTVCLLDDGLDYSNPDLTDAYNAKGSYDFNENDYDPCPAPAQVSMLKILDGTVIDSMEAMAYNYQHRHQLHLLVSWGRRTAGTSSTGRHVLG
uniref:Peptidase_S8 domain-containing protein n=1 Tax=Macrostomum lignano TaxID=282301 RepID=A0A1I8FCK3_9PLAT